MRFGLKTFARAWRFLIDTVLHLVGLIDHRWYMRLFARVMRGRGMNLQGIPRYVSPRCYIDGSDYSLITLGDGVVISSGVRLLTHDFAIDRIERDADEGDTEVVRILPITIGRRCFIGAGSILLPGTELGDNVIVGAGSVVRGRFGPNQVLLGNPAESAMSTTVYRERLRSRGQTQT